MADPIRLPNSAPKDLSTAKVARTAGQKFDHRRKRQPGKSDMRHSSNKDQEGFPAHGDDAGAYVSNSRKKTSADHALGEKSGDKSTGDQGRVIDIRI